MKSESTVTGYSGRLQLETTVIDATVKSTKVNT